MAVYLFAGVAVSDFAAALAWYECLLGSPPEHAGHAMHAVIVDDLDTTVAQMARRGLEPAKQETYGNGVRKTTYVDPDGNEIGFGEVPR
jgi:predicted enzyme related to lactoylglutathione lyase